jgi:DNA topoisomerase-3
MKEIEKGNFSPDDFMQGIVQFTKQLIVESDFSKINDEIYGDCPKCKSPVIKGNRGYGCSKWREECSFVLWKKYKNIEFNERQIRTLLQKRVLLQAIEGAILTLSCQGELTEITLPSEQGNCSPIKKRRTRSSKKLS